MIDGKKRNLSNRQRCLACSPFGIHNTAPVKVGPAFKCKCGEISPNEFYSHRPRICKKCHTEATTKRGQEKREFIRSELGKICSRCDFDGLTCCYDAHHLDASKKDPQFKGIRSWSLARIKKEIANCVLLCKNCHAIVHSELRNSVCGSMADH